MMIQNNILTVQGNNVFNAIWANVELRGSLFPATLQINLNDLESIKENFKSQFIILISQTTNSFYNFINVK